MNGPLPIVKYQVPACTSFNLVYLAHLGLLFHFYSAFAVLVFCYRGDDL
jgi:hypothetical protein